MLKRFHLNGNTVRFTLVTEKLCTFLAVPIRSCMYVMN